MREIFNKDLVVLCLVLTLLLPSLFPGITGIEIEHFPKTESNSRDSSHFQEDVKVTCYTFGLPGETSRQISIPIEKAEYFQKKIESLQSAIAYNPQSDETSRLIQEIIDFTEENNLLPERFSMKKFQSRFIHPRDLSIPQKKAVDVLQQTRGSEIFCNYVSTGSGSALPVIIFPRLFPILLTPIPRFFVKWSVVDGVTSCGGLLTGTGFIASGSQNGFALGFWGIGFSVFLPPLMAYLLLGYALFVTVSAEEIEYWPPNYPPDINVVSPPDGSINIPISTSELRFYISDQNGDLMNYTVTTEPFVGSGSGSNKPDGTYSVPISDLEGSEEYIWHVQVSDGEDIADEFFSFTTEMVAPIISDPRPEDGARYISVDLSQLSFKLNDPQDDLMDYTVETSPDIGSSSGSGVNDGTYTVDLSGLDYTTKYMWYVNVTDGVNWKHKIFDFQTEPKMVFDPFVEGWQYRKRITIDHTKVAGNLTNFPVLVSTIDSDLRDKAQNDGDDILFMNDTGVATRLYHEIEHFDGSTGDLVAWVNMSFLVSDQDNILYMYYGNTWSSSQEFSEKVWDSSFEAVWHMNDLTSSTIGESTMDNWIGTKADGQNQPLEVDGKIGKAQDFERENTHYIHFNGNEIYLVGSNKDLTVSTWVKVESIGEEEFTTLFGNNRGTSRYYVLCLREHGRPQLGIWDGTGPSAIKVDSPEPLSAGIWYYIVATLDRDTNLAHIYVNGIQKDSEDISSEGSYAGQAFEMGTSENSPKRYWMDGILDECRLYNTPRSQQWISTEFNNQYNPSNFLSFEPEEKGP